jgi:hypothetical protein
MTVADDLGARLLARAKTVRAGIDELRAHIDHAPGILANFVRQVYDDDLRGAEEAWRLFVEAASAITELAGNLEDRTNEVLEAKATAMRVEAGLIDLTAAMRTIHPAALGQDAYLARRRANELLAELRHVDDDR